MTTLNPSIAVRPKADIALGSLVQLNGARGFCTVSPRDPLQKFLVMYDQRRRTFGYALMPEMVLDFGTDLVIAPGLESLVENLLPSPDGTCELLFPGDSPKIMFRISGGDNTVHLLDLKTGSLDTLRRTAGMIGIRKWSIGVKAVDGGFLSLLKVRALTSSASDDDGPTEPDEV